MNEGTNGSQIGDPATSVLADNLSEAAIMAAVKAGRTVVQLRSPMDAFADMTMKDKSGSDAEIGDEVDGVDNISISSHVTGGDGDRVELWRNGVKVDSQVVSGADATATFSRKPTGDLERYRIQVVDGASNQTIVITSHIWVQGVVPPEGCGCQSSGKAGATSIALFGLALLVLRRKRR
jgi:MYXO-CTERM domain-containing protein